MKQIYIFTTILCFSIITAQAQTVINPVSATTTYSSSNLENAYDGTGLESFPSLTANHGQTHEFNSFLGFPITGTIDFNLGGSFLIDGLSFWQTAHPHLVAGINGVNFLSSTDGITYTLIAGAPTSFAPVYDPFLITPQQFTFNPISASYIRMQVLSNYGAPNFSGFAEIAFAEGATLGTESSFDLESVILYPNPSSDFISVSGVTGNKSYVVYDLLGKEVLKGTILKNDKINIQSIDSGMYFIQLESTDSIKFIKE